MRVAEDGVGDDEDGVGGVGDVSHNKVEDGFCQGVGIVFGGGNDNAARHHDVVDGGDDGGGDGHHVVEDGFRQGQGVAKGVCEEEGQAGLQT